MGAVYDIEGKLSFKSANAVVKATQNFISSYDGARFSDTDFTDLEDALVCIFTRRVDISNETDTFVEFYSGFDASYGWEGVMLDWFEACASVLADGSELRIFPDSGSDIGVVQNGKVSWNYTDEEDDDLQEAIDSINAFSLSEYGNEAVDENTDLSDIGILYTTDGGDNEVELQISVDLLEPSMLYYINGELRHTDTYEDLRDLIDSDLDILDFDDLYNYILRFAKKTDYDPDSSYDYIDRRDD